MKAWYLKYKQLPDDKKQAFLRSSSKVRQQYKTLWSPEHITQLAQQLDILIRNQPKITLQDVAKTLEERPHRFEYSSQLAVLVVSIITIWEEIYTSESAHTSNVTKYCYHVNKVLAENNLL